MTYAMSMQSLVGGRTLPTARLLLAVVAAVSMSACGGGSNGSGNAPADRMLIMGKASSPIIDRLGQSFAADTYTGAQDVSQYKLIIYDGNTIEPAALGTDALIDTALAEGVSVLIVNASAAHKQALEAPGRAAVAVGGDSYGYLLTPFTQPGGRRAVHITYIRDTDYELRSTRVVDENSGLLTGSTETRTEHHDLTPALIHAFVDLVKRRVAGDAGDSLGGGTSPPSDVIWFSAPVTEAFVQSSVDLDNQMPTQTLTYTFRVFLDNGDLDPNRWFQWAMVEVSGQMSPGSLLYYNDRERGWSQSVVQVYVTPVNTAQGGGLNLQTFSTSPNAPSNGAYDSTSEFEITYTTKGGMANQAYQWSETLPLSPISLSDWTVSEPSAAVNQFLWQWNQTAPFNTEENNYRSAFHHGFFVLDFTVDELPPFSIGEIPLAAQGVWRTSAVVDQPIAIDHHAVRTFVLLQAKYESPGIYDRDWWVKSANPGPLEIAVDFSQATPGN
jgi:hypothetical protein